MSRKLASVQKILDIQPIDGADRIEVASVLGWKVVVKKGEFEVGDRAVYFEVDSLLPRATWNDFLADKNKPDAPIRLKTIKLRGQVSQGLLVPVSILDGTDADIEEGTDLTEALGVEKYEVPIPACLGGDVKGPRPSYTPMTDEIRVQACPEVIDEFQGKEVYITQKIDGTSCTISFMNGDVNVCGRNWAYKDDVENTYWKVANKYDIPAKLSKVRQDTGGNFAIQGEVAGPSIQKNRLALKDHELFVFNVIDLNGRKYLDFEDFKEFCKRLDLPTVPVLHVCTFNWKSVDELLELAKGKYASGQHQEGIVIRAVREFESQTLKGRSSFKVINNDFLLKGGD